MTCIWLGNRHSHTGGFYCGFYGPCPALDVKDCDCPVIEYARKFEEACRNPDVIEREKRMLVETI